MQFDAVHLVLANTPVPKRQRRCSKPTSRVISRLFKVLNLMKSIPPCKLYKTHLNIEFSCGILIGWLTAEGLYAQHPFMNSI